MRLPNVFWRPKPIARPKRAGEDGERGEIDAEQVDADEEGDDDDGDPGELLGEQLLGRRRGSAARRIEWPTTRLSSFTTA